MAPHPVHTTNDLPQDHWLRRHAPAGTSLRPYAEDRAVSILTGAAIEAIEGAGMTRAEVARVLGTTKSYVSQVLNGSTNMTLKTLGALLWAAGQQVCQLGSEPMGAESRAKHLQHYAATTSGGPADDAPNTYQTRVLSSTYRLSSVQ
jgi:hypothetical protein